MSTQSNYKKDYEYSEIVGIGFSTYSPEQIKNLSVANITKTQLYDSNGEPTIGGLFDPKMGYIEPGKRCKTCFQTFITCPGHPGHIELAKPIFNIQYETEIVKILKCICIKCSRLLINKNNPWVKNLINTTKHNRKERFEKLYSVISKKNKKCGGMSEKPGSIFDFCGCGAIQPSKYINNIKADSQIICEWKSELIDGNQNDIVQNINAEILLSIFKRIPEEDAMIMGFSKDWCLPWWLIISILPVCPPCVRPSVRQYNNQRSEDDLTHKYNDIIKYNDILKDKLASNNISPEYVKNYTDMVQYHVSTLFNNDIKGIAPATTRSGRPMKTFTERLKGKEGRIRHNLMGKRVDYSSRTVISPDANLEIDQLGVPIRIAMNLTFPDIVNKYNMNQLYKKIRSGNKVYPGAKSIKSIKDGKTRLLDYLDTNKLVLEIGDVVNRHLVNDDIVLFNRQPSLHKMSMMAHRVRVMEGNTFRLNVDVCKPYNADFDGDEMNMHVPQSLQTSIELEELALVSKHIISPSVNKPIIQPSQDNLLGVYKLTENGIEFTHKEVMNMMMGVKKFNGTLPEPAIKNGNYIRWTGKQVFSLILPPISFKKSVDTDQTPYLENVVIDNGILKQGQVDKQISEPILHTIFNEYGYKEATRYLNDLQKVVTRFMTRCGFSVGISDLILHKDIKKKNQTEIYNGKKNVIDLTKKMHLNILSDVSTGLDQIYDAKVRATVAEITEKINKNSSRMLNNENRINFMVNSGSKGGIINIQQMMYLLGEQVIDNKRVPLGFSHRSLPHYPKYENGVESRGFVANNFIDGLNPQEFFFHAMSGREGLIDTAVKTASSGYLQRKLVKATEDLKANHDYTVRSSNLDIVQFVYGEDGFYPSYLEKQRTKLADISQDTLDKDYLIKDTFNFENYVLKKELNKVDESDFKKSMKEYNQMVKESLKIIYESFINYVGDINDLLLFYPIDLKKLMNNTVIQYKLNTKCKTDLHPHTIIQKIKELYNYCVVNGHKNYALLILLVDNLSPIKLVRDIGMNKIAFKHLCNSIKLRFENSLVEGAEMVGPLAAQSIGEVSTQLTLNTFHLAGVGEKSNVTRGVPRLHELLSNTKNPKQPSCFIYLDEKYRYDRDLAAKVGNNIECNTIGDLLTSEAIYLDPSNDLNNMLDEDKNIMNIYKIFSKLDPQHEQIPDNPWIIRLEFNRQKIIEKKITMDDIHNILSNKYPNALLMFSDDNASKLIFRLRLPFANNPEKADDDILYLKQKIDEISNITIKGVQGITKIYTPAVKHLYLKQGDVYTKKEEYILERPDGSNLFDLIIRDEIDSTRTYSIDPNEMMIVFGIEVARFMLENQLIEVFGTKVNPRHIGVLCDRMNRGGDFMSVDRHGINKENIGPLAKSSFEETTDQLQSASLFGEVDDISGVSSNIMVGQIPPCGTGDSMVLLDEEMLLQQSEVDEDAEDDDINKYFESSQFCAENDDIQFNLNAVEDENLDVNVIPEVMVS
jgi:DNA-directed RNA polymerase II subunit RPB1